MTSSGEELLHSDCQYFFARLASMRNACKLVRCMDEVHDSGSKLWSIVTLRLSLIFLSLNIKIVLYSWCVSSPLCPLAVQQALSHTHSVCLSPAYSRSSLAVPSRPTRPAQTPAWHSQPAGVAQRQFVGRPGPRETTCANSPG